MSVALVPSGAVSVVEAVTTATSSFLTVLLPSKADMDRARSPIAGVTQQKAWLVESVRYGLTLMHTRKDVYPGSRLRGVILDAAGQFHISGVSGGGFVRSEIWGRHSPAPVDGGKVFFQIDLDKVILPSPKHPQGKFTAHWRLFARVNRAASDMILSGGCRYEIVLADGEDYNS